ncbi:hypothetical protein AQUCO_03400265v1 [Aquilegia coerulea]|uniref:RRM domain-containing protein n=1 Tax=Aquilegia coerulea TaxID=218851 RepID=A0A2G5CY96_AQUCA|nr:hypothetical protein AQUCO_03400265v1 [Aquilegia coerulea]
MAAVAGATISSCLSARRVNSKHVASFDCVFRIGCRRTLQVASLSHVHLVDSLSIKAVTNKWRNVRIAASVIEEELAGAVEVESVEEKVEEKEVVEELGEVEAKAEAEPEAEAESEVKDEPTINTKLYIGNLPYNCDSAQLAGIIQEYGSPELIEVLYDRVTGRSRGFAFVTMSSIEDCNAVIENLDRSVRIIFHGLLILV